MSKSRYIQYALLFLLIFSLCLVWLSQLLGLIIFSIISIFVIIDLIFQKRFSDYIFLSINNYIGYIIGLALFFLYIVNLFNMFDFLNLTSTVEFAALIILFSVFGFARIFIIYIMKKDYFYPNIKVYLIITSLFFVSLDTISNGKLGIIAGFFTGVILLLEVPDLLLKHIADTKKINRDGDKTSEFKEN
jgi:hypothetical protein